MSNRSTQSVAPRARRRAGAAAAITALALALTGCGADQPTQPDPGTTAATSITDTPTSPAATPEATSPAELAATLDRPEGTENYALTICVSIAETTIQGAGASADWNLTFDANLLTPDDTGTLQVSRASDNALEYDADITTLTVQPDGTFDATGQDPAGNPFRLTGTCTLSR